MCPPPAPLVDVPGCAVPVGEACVTGGARSWTVSSGLRVEFVGAPECQEVEEERRKHVVQGAAHLDQAWAQEVREGRER